jgi:PPOX class probable F420-dependent enzyme
VSRQLTWAEVARRLAPSRSYWLATTSADGAPHSVPVWGVVLDEVLYFYSVRSTVKARNIARDPRAVVHLESGDDVLIVRGTIEDVGAPSDVPQVVAAFAQKYTAAQDARYLPSADPTFDVIYAFRPQSARAWSIPEYDTSQSGWSAT